MQDRFALSSGYPAIADYAILGDCHTAALVSRDGSIDWYCPERFDGPAVFCRLLDWQRGGYWRLAPTSSYQVARQYRGPTNVLETTFTTSSGQVRLTDCMPVFARPSGPGSTDVGTLGHVLRLVEVLSGEVELAVEFKPTFAFARTSTRVTPAAGRGAVADAGGAWLTLACPGLALVDDGGGGWRGTLNLRTGERRWLALTPSRDATAAEAALAVADGAEHLATTLALWEAWAARCTYRGAQRAAVVRSALTLKLLTYEPTGAIVAAPTTSLPEAIGGARNWDYRYTWLRDSSLILYALKTIGYDASAAAFHHWLTGVCTPKAVTDLQIMYGIDGEHDLTEIELPHLTGYRDSRPVRVGNGAATQRQLDIYGELIVTASLNWLAHPDHHGSSAPEPPDASAWAMMRAIADYVAAVWQEPDSGIWEVRGGPQQFLYSRLLCWAAIDRALRLAERYRLPAPRANWQRTRAAIREAILTRGYDARQSTFTQAFDSPRLDASALVIPLLGFLPATDPRFQTTVARIRQELTQHGLVSRYRTSETDDGLSGSEGAFVLCTFWLVDALALGGRLDEARALFEQVVGFANDVGLLSEEIDPVDRLLLGNFPQGFSHLALIRSAVNLAKVTRHGAEDRAETETDRMLLARAAASNDHADAAGPPSSPATEARS